MNAKMIDFCINEGSRGLVIEGMGRGNVPPDVVLSIEKALKKNIPVVIVSRCYQGRVLDSYGYPGGGKDLRKILLGSTRFRTAGRFTTAHAAFLRGKATARISPAGFSGCQRVTCRPCICARNTHPADHHHEGLRPGMGRSGVWNHEVVLLA